MRRAYLSLPLFPSFLILLFFHSFIPSFFLLEKRDFWREREREKKRSSSLLLSFSASGLFFKNFSCSKRCRWRPPGRVSRGEDTSHRVRRKEPSLSSWLSSASFLFPVQVWEHDHRVRLVPLSFFLPLSFLLSSCPTSFKEHKKEDASSLRKTFLGWPLLLFHPIQVSSLFLSDFFPLVFSSFLALFLKKTLLLSCCLKAKRKGRGREREGKKKREGKRKEVKRRKEETWIYCQIFSSTTHFLSVNTFSSFLPFWSSLSLSLSLSLSFLPSSKRVTLDRLSMWVCITTGRIFQKNLSWSQHTRIPLPGTERKVRKREREKERNWKFERRKKKDFICEKLEETIF